MSNRIFSIFLVVFLGAVSIIAQDTQLNKTDKPDGAKISVSATHIERLHLAYEAAKYGRATKLADAMILAAKILKEIPADKLNIEKKIEGGTENAVAKSKSTEMTADAFLKDARAFAKHDKSLLSRIAAVEKIVPDTRGAVNGPRRSSTQVKANATDVFPIQFRANEQAVIAVSGDGDTDLDLYIYDQNGNLIISDTNGLDDCIVRFYPKRSGTFYVRVKNLGNVYNSYVLATN